MSSRGRVRGGAGGFRRSRSRSRSRSRVILTGGATVLAGERLVTAGPHENTSHDRLSHVSPELERKVREWHPFRQYLVQLIRSRTYLDDSGSPWFDAGPYNMTVFSYNKIGKMLNDGTREVTLSVFGMDDDYMEISGQVTYPFRLDTYRHWKQDLDKALQKAASSLRRYGP